jgi:hypothetical protein
MQTTLQHWAEVFDKEFSFGAHFTAKKSKQITYNPLSKIVFVYADKALVASSTELQEMLDLYNSISIR